MKYALVTGATGGLGGEVAKALAQEGWFVFAAGRSEKALQTLAETTTTHPLKLDITSQESVEEAYQNVLKETDHLDALINFSGVQNMGSLIESDLSLIQSAVEVNLIGMARMNKVFFPLVEKCKGRIINCSSECGWMTPQPFNGSYSLSKYAVEAYNDSLRRELMFVDVPVIKIQPGSFKTAMHGKTVASFDKMMEETTRYKDVLEVMKFMMQIELKNVNDPKYLVKATLKAANAKNPKNLYRVKNSKLLGSLEIIPGKMLDRIYKGMLSSKAVSNIAKKLSAKIS